MIKQLSIDSDTRVISELIVLYLLELRDDGTAVHTIRNRGYLLRKFVSYLKEQGIETVDELERHHIRDYLGEQSQKGHKMTSINTMRRMIRWFLCWVLTDQVSNLRFDPRAARELRDKPEPDLNFVPLTHEVVYGVIDKMTNDQDKLMTALIFEGGLRISELVTLRIESVHFDELRIYGKGDRLRPVYIPPRLARELERYIEDSGRTYGNVFIPQLRFNRNQYSIDTVRQRIKRWFDGEGVDMWIHLLRHSYAIGMVQRGADIRSVQLMLGHRNIDTTMRYLKFSDPFLKEQYNKYRHK